MAPSDGPTGPGTMVRPFPGLLIRTEWAARVVAPMMDALTPERREELLAARPDSYLHVAGDEGTAVLRRLVEIGAYERTEPAVYVYRLRGDGTEHTGVVAEVGISAFVDGRVRAHESVDPQRVEGLVRHFAAVPARSEPVALLHTPDDTAARIVTATREGAPVVHFELPGGLEQTVWRVADDAVPRLVEALSAHRHYIADGHHRVAASLQWWEDAGRPAGAGVLCVLYPIGELDLRSFHRRVPGPVDAGALVSRLSTDFDLTRVTDPRDGSGAFRMYVDGQWWDVADPTTRASGVEGLDVTVLHRCVLAPLLGGTDPDVHRAGRLETIPEQTPLPDLVARCDADAGALFLVRAPGIPTLVDIADRGERVPPKTTYFAPKPQAGLFVRLSPETA